jgi:hypothetical protein
LYKKTQVLGLECQEKPPQRLLLLLLLLLLRSWWQSALWANAGSIMQEAAHHRLLGALLLLTELPHRLARSEDVTLLPLPMLRLDLRSSSLRSMCCTVSWLAVASTSRLASPGSQVELVCSWCSS